MSSYQYDPMGRRAKKTVDGSLTEFFYDGTEVLLEYDSLDNITARYIYGAGIDQPILMEKNGSQYYYHSDHQGSIIAISDGTTGAVVEQYAYSPYGESNDNSTIGNPYRYTGRRLDDETGLYYYRARMYSTNIGRFLQPDPIGYGDGLNLYAYVGNDSVNLVDPFGTTGKIANTFSSLGTGDRIQFGLDLAASSETPYVSQIAGLSAAVIYAAQGDALSASSSVGGLIPAYGIISDGARVGSWVVKAAKNVKVKPQDFNFETKRQALRQAKRDAGIPTSQTHKTHIKDVRTDRLGGKGNDLVFDNGKTIQHHKTGHNFKNNPKSQHFNNHPETKNHYIYNK